MIDLTTANIGDRIKYHQLPLYSDTSRRPRVKHTGKIVTFIERDDKRVGCEVAPNTRPGQTETVYLEQIVDIRGTAKRSRKPKSQD